MNELPSDDIIYHYTSIDTLAQILKNRNLRFNRLDFVDDIEEGAIECGGINFGKYCFVSCWTEDKEESIPMWRMYAANGDGVRIGMRLDMFKRHMISGITMNGKSTVGSAMSILPIDGFVNQSYFFLPVSSRGPKYDSLFYHRVQYVEEVQPMMKDVVTEDGEVMKIDISKIGLYKNSVRWSFQKESRFRLIGFPYNPINEYAIEKVGCNMINMLKTNLDMPIRDYYLDLSEEAMAAMEIVLNPGISKGNRVIVETLKEHYAPSATIKNSALGGFVRW